MNISRDKQDFWSKVWQQKLCDLRISRGRFFAPYFGGQKLDLYAEKYGIIIIIIIIITIIFIVITIYFVSILTFLLRFVKGFSLILQDFCIVYIVMNTFVTEMLQPDNFVALKCKFYSQLCMWISLQ